jgi:hypothetical protein
MILVSSLPSVTDRLVAIAILAMVASLVAHPRAVGLQVNVRTAAPENNGFGQVIAAQTWGTCEAWNNWDGYRFDGKWTPTANRDGENGLCAPGDGWVAYNLNRIGGIYGSEVLKDNPECFDDDNDDCFVYRMWKGSNGPHMGMRCNGSISGEGDTDGCSGGGAFKFSFGSVVETSSIFISHIFKIAPNMKFCDRDEETPGTCTSRDEIEPSWIKWVDINNGSKEVDRFVGGFGQGGACIGSVQKSQNYNTNCKGSRAPFHELRPGTWYCHAVYVDVTKGIRRTWRGPYGGNIKMIQDAKSDLKRAGGNNLHSSVIFLTNHSWVLPDNDPKNADAVDATDKADVWLDNIVISTQQPEKVTCELPS